MTKTQLKKFILAEKDRALDALCTEYVEKEKALKEKIKSDISVKEFACSINKRLQEIVDDLNEWKKCAKEEHGVPRADAYHGLEWVLQSRNYLSADEIVIKQFIENEVIIRHHKDVVNLKEWYNSTMVEVRDNYNIIHNNLIALKNVKDCCEYLEGELGFDLSGLKDEPVTALVKPVNMSYILKPIVNEEVNEEGNN